VQLSKPVVQLRVPLTDAASRLNGAIASKPQSSPRPEEPTLEDADRLGDPDDPLDCRDFDLEVYHFMRSAETSNLPSPDLFSNQPSVTPRMRATVVDWLVEVHRKLRMHTDTLYLTVNLIDQYLTVNTIDKADLQRLGCAALLLAAKGGELHPPVLIDFVELSDQSFSADALKQMEASLFASVHFRVDPVLPSMFLKRFLRLAKPDLRLSMLSHFVLESSLLEPEFIGMVPSKLAAAAICLATALERGPNQWDSYLQKNTGYALQHIADTAQKLFHVIVTASTGRFQAIRKKYSTQPMCRVSAGPFPETAVLQ
jgi:hypothetical protein